MGCNSALRNLQNHLHPGCLQHASVPIRDLTVTVLDGHRFSWLYPPVQELQEQVVERNQKKLKKSWSFFPKTFPKSSSRSRSPYKAGITRKEARKGKSSAGLHFFHLVKLADNFHPVPRRYRIGMKVCSPLVVMLNTFNVASCNGRNARFSLLWISLYGCECGWSCLQQSVKQCFACLSCLFVNPYHCLYWNMKVAGLASRIIEDLFDFFLSQKKINSL